MSVRDRVPKPLRTPIGLSSMVVMLAGLAVGYILTVLGITLYYDLNGLGDAISNWEAIQVTLVGLACFVVGYLGWRGFLYFSY
jgi:hypothetical protein